MMPKRDFDELSGTGNDISHSTEVVETRAEIFRVGEERPDRFVPQAREIKHPDWLFGEDAKHSRGIFHFNGIAEAVLDRGIRRDLDEATAAINNSDVVEPEAHNAEPRLFGPHIPWYDLEVTVIDAKRDNGSRLEVGRFAQVDRCDLAGGKSQKKAAPVG
jgi:hypothetical protein